MRRGLRQIFSYIALGLATTIVLAWLDAVLPLDHTLPAVPLSADAAHPRRWTNAIEFRRFVGRRHEWLPLSPLDPETNFDDLCTSWRKETDAAFNSPPGLDLPKYWGILVEPYDWPAWARLPRGRAADSGLRPDQGMSIDARGFPLPALRCSTILQGPSARPTPHPVTHGIALRQPTGAINDAWSALPLAPIPLNLALDTLFFAAALFGGPRAFVAIRGSVQRARRHRRNLCPRCAYSLSGLPPDAPCPECGKDAA